MSEQSRPPAGWYPVGDSERYWDGLGWTDLVRAPAPTTNPAPSAVDVHGFTHQSPAPAWPPPQPSTIRSAWPVGYPAVPTAYGYVAPKNPGLSVLASFFLPGLGSVINGDVGRGIFIMIGYFVSWLLVIALIGIVGIVGFWIWGLVDAYQGARLWNARHGILS